MAHQVRALRTRLGLTQEQLAERAGIRRQEANKIEVGKNQCSSARIQRGLAKGFGLPLDHLLAYLDARLPLDAAVALIESKAS